MWQWLLCQGWQQGSLQHIRLVSDLVFPLALWLG